MAAEFDIKVIDTAVKLDKSLKLKLHYGKYYKFVDPDTWGEVWDGWEAQDTKENNGPFIVTSLY